MRAIEPDGRRATSAGRGWGGEGVGVEEGVE